MGSVVSNLGEHSNMRIAFFLIVVATINFTSARPKRRNDELMFNPSMVRQDGPLNMEALNMLHADAVKYGQGAKNNKWFEAVDAKTLDGMITQMNTMNRWFAKVVKYWDDFTSGGDGSNVLAENGPGIQKMPKNAEGAEDKDAAADGADASGDDTKAAESETDAAAADAEAPADGEGDKDAPAEDEAAGEGEPPAGDDGAEEAPKGDAEEAPADGDKAADKEAAADGEKPAEGDAAAADDKAAAADPPAETEGEGKEEPPAARRKRMRRMRRRQR